MSNEDLKQRAWVLVQKYDLPNSLVALDDLEDRLVTLLAVYRQGGEDDDPSMEELEKDLETTRAIKAIHDQALQK